MTTDTNALVRVEHLGKSFGALHALSDINLEIQKGEVVVIIGPSGSGKSTLLRSLNLLEHPTEGKIFLRALILPTLLSISTSTARRWVWCSSISISFRICRF